MLPKLPGSESDYSGDIVEEKYRPVTFSEMPYWWHFHEVLQASAQGQTYWKDASGASLGDRDQRIMVAFSLSSYGVYCGVAEALAFLQNITAVLITDDPEEWQLHEARRFLKAAYSALYTAYSMLCNIVSSLIEHQAPWGNDDNKPRVKLPGVVLKTLEARGLTELANPLRQIGARLDIRHQFDHFWTIWTSVNNGRFLLDSHFVKGYVVVDPDQETEFSVDAVEKLSNDIRTAQQAFNHVYFELAVYGGFLDQFLTQRGWQIDYSGKVRTGGQRPQP